MKLTNISGFNDIYEYVHHKIECYGAEEKNFGTLFKYMFSERENIMAETSDGYRIKKITYGEFQDMILSVTPTVAKALSGVKQDGIVGIYMSNSVEWLLLFWATLASGHRVLLMNTRLSDDILEATLAEHSVGAVISDGQKFSVLTLDAEELCVPSGEAYAPREFGSEVIFMSSGTTDKVKLCAYTGESFYYQICDSVSIIDRCPQMKEHYGGELKQLTLLPFCHVFGFIAVYIWFGFFARTFVFLKDMNPATILNTVKKHKVTHIFAVPLVWDTVYKEAMRTIRARGAGTYRKFKIAERLANSLGGFGKKLSELAFGEVRDNIFGDSIKFLISGGSHIEEEVLSFFNGIGYHMANGYGMTEIGITSVEISEKRRILNSGSIGTPFGHTEYSLGNGGELLVRGKAMPSRIIIGGEEFITDHNEWFNTHDLVKFVGGRYYHEGRRDDMIVCDNGENINPLLIERRLKVDGVDALCLISDERRVPTLIASVPGCFSAEKLGGIANALARAIESEKLSGEVRRIVLTTDRLLGESDFKISRRKVSERYLSGRLHTIEPEHISEHSANLASELEVRVREYMAEALEKPVSEIGADDNFFIALGGTSLDYFTLISLIKSNFGVDIPTDGDEKPVTLGEICAFIKNTI